MFNIVLPDKLERNEWGVALDLFSAALNNPLRVRFVAKNGEPIISGIELRHGNAVAIFNGNN